MYGFLSLDGRVLRRGCKNLVGVTSLAVLPLSMRVVMGFQTTPLNVNVRGGQGVIRWISLVLRVDTEIQDTNFLISRNPKR